MTGWRRSGTFSAVIAISICAAASSAAWARGQRKHDVANGQKLFEHVWQANDSLSGDGGGLGPLFNERSCVACHSLGGIGGAGPNETNDVLLTYIPPAIRPNMQQVQEELAILHPGFEGTTTALLHRHGTSPDYAPFCVKLLGLKVPDDDPIRRALEPGTIEGEEVDGSAKTIEIAQKKFKISQRNPPALFGAGLINKIPPAVIQSVAAIETAENPNVHGQFVGRFGWRGQVASLGQFTSVECAAQFGLNMGEFSPAVDPTRRGEEATERAKRELSNSQLGDLIAFVSLLPLPRQLRPTDAAQLRALKHGEQVFGNVGCAVCHRESLGFARGIFSDLLLHDMGERLSDPAAATAKIWRIGGGPIVQFNGARRSGFTATELPLYQAQQLWRTPPLWGLHDSGPYLHDGRAATIQEAIAAHGGEATDSLELYQRLAAADRDHLLAFLDSLVAPDAAAVNPKTAR